MPRHMERRAGRSAYPSRPPEEHGTIGDNFVPGIGAGMDALMQSFLRFQGGRGNQAAQEQLRKRQEKDGAKESP